MENNMNNHAGMEERGNSGHNKSRHFNKNKKRFDKNHMSDNARSNDRDNERANDKKGGENFHKNNHKKNGEFRHKNHGDSFKRFKKFILLFLVICVNINCRLLEGCENK